MLRIGMFLGGRYEILEHIGTGGMSDVYKAKCHKLNRLVAIKVLKEEFNADNNFVSKFRAEAQASACLSHPNIVNVYDVGDEADIHYIVMELVGGITLKNYIAKKGHLEVRETIGIAIQVAQGLEAAHEQKIVHRDIKPQNIIISKEGKVKVADFGIARAASSQTISSGAQGSVHYISPEQARGGYCDERSDIYSMGVTLYEMLTGHVPFDGETAVAVAMNHIQKEAVSPKKYNSSVPISLEKIVQKCMQKRPEQRYQSVTALITDLKHALMNPNEDFVKILPLKNDSPTMIMSEDEMAKIKEGSRKASLETSQEEQDYLLGLEEDFDEEIEEEEESELEEFEELDAKASKVEKIITGVIIFFAVVILLLILFIGGKLLGLFDQETTAPETTTTEADSTLTKVPDLIGTTLKEAEQLLKEANLGKYVSYAFSDKFEEGEVITFGTGEYDTRDFVELQAGDTVEKYTTITLVLSSGKSMIQVPNILGMTEEQAKSVLVNAGFSNFVVEEDRETEGYDVGEVCKVSPGVGKNAPADGQITLYVYAPEMIEMPDLSTYLEEEIDAVLEDLGLVPVAKSEYSDTVEEGKLISQSVEAGEQVAKGTKIEYVISNGKNYKVPDVRDYGLEEAKAKLEAAGYVVKVEEFQTDKNSEIGQVIKQNFPGGTELPRGSEVTITVGVRELSGGGESEGSSESAE